MSEADDWLKIPGRHTIDIVALAAGIDPVLFDAPLANPPNTDQPEEQAVRAVVRPSAGAQVVFIDGAIADAGVLAAGVNPGVVAVILPVDQDGVKAIATWLTEHAAHDLGSIAIVSHGANGLLRLGDAILETGTIPGYEAELARIGSALRQGGDIQLYGCDVAQDAKGQAFVERLATATGGAHIAAASHAVGSTANGGSFDLDVNTGLIEATTPFTQDTQRNFGDLLPTGLNQLFFTTRNAPAPFTFNRIGQIGVAGTLLSADAPINLRDGSQQTFTVLQGVAVDPSLGKYFAVNSNASTANQILQGNVLTGGSLSTFLSLPLSTHQIPGIAIDQPRHDLYYSVASNIAGSVGIWKINEFSTTPTQVISGFTTSNVPQKMALDLSHNLIFFVDNRGVANASTLWVGNVLNGKATVLTTQPVQNQLSGVAVNNGTLYYSIVNGQTTFIANNKVLSAPITYSGSGTTATASLGVSTTLYAGANARFPADVEVDPVTGLLYTGGSGVPTGSATVAFINVGTITGGGSVQTVFTLDNGTNGVTVQDLFLETMPTITASGTVTHVQGGSAITLVPSASVTNPSGFNLAKATVAITGGNFTNDGDTLTAITSGTSISASFAGDLLTLTGDDSLAHYQQVLRTVAYRSTATDPTNGGANATRTLTWTVNDGIIASSSPVTTVSIHGLPTVVAGGISNFLGGGLAVTLDPALTVTDPYSTTLTGATISLSGFISGDVLNFTNLGGIIGTYNTSNGTLSLSGTVSVASYQTALRSITYSFNPGNGDPTAGGGRTTQSVKWIVTDGVTTSTAATSTLNTIHVAPTITTTGTVTFGGGKAPPALDPTLTVIAPNSKGLLSGAKVTIDGSAFPGDGDVLRAVTIGTAITFTYNPATEVATLAGTDTVANYQRVLRSITIDNTSPDPTSGGTHPTRTFSWTVNDGVATSAASTSAATALVCFCRDTLILTPDGDVPIQTLRPGDMVLTHSGEARAITWIGTGHVPTVLGRRTAANPIILRKGALADNVPHTDLHVTKGHSFFLDGVLIPAEFLVNHRTILWDDDARDVTVFHLELDTHDVLVANGAPAESYRDDGNRWLFGNGNSGWDQPPKPPFAPVLTGGPIVDAVWQRLLDRAPPEPTRTLTEDPDLHLLADGVRINPARKQGGRFVFNLPGPARELRIVSRSDSPAELGLARDPRVLGVAIHQMQMWRGPTLRVIEASQDDLSIGFHGFEAGNAIRWTDGNALVPAALLHGIDGPCELVLLVDGSMRYRTDTHLAA